MDESKPDPSSDKEAKGLKVKTRRLRDDIDVNTPIGDIKGPNVLERAKEEFVAIVEAIQQRKEGGSPSSVRRDNCLFKGSKNEKPSSPAGTPRNKETHGLRDDIDVNTPLSDIKGPNVFERVKEEFEAIVEIINQRREEKNQDSPSSVERDDAFTGSKYEKQSSPEEDNKSGSSKLKQVNVKVKPESPKRKPSFIHHKETHGKGEDIDVNTPISEFRGLASFIVLKKRSRPLLTQFSRRKNLNRIPRHQRKRRFPSFLW
ncbi:hypothetical protein OSB04_020437 [Centaurea solstitialis]|uniref:Uncharacterized protein n=1 Tax=Centaurea solstitialis TaxID=347529 RepID=A0AA38WF85_9ASTR|nr:hypothetical protein OSB04_020437 [Centaurea solstitialis]